MKSQAQSHGSTGNKRRTLHVMGILLLATVGFGLISASAGAHRDYTSCGHFETQGDAQESFDDGSVSNPEYLDGDGDGIACEDAFGIGGGATRRKKTQFRASRSMRRPPW